MRAQAFASDGSAEHGAGPAAQGPPRLVPVSEGARSAGRPTERTPSSWGQDAALGAARPAERLPSLEWWGAVPRPSGMDIR